MAGNFKAWDLKLSQFNRLKSEEEKLKFIISFAVLAPSSHNSQPWKFKVRKMTIEVYFEQERSLPVGDPEDRLSFISIGCALKNLITAADYYGYKTQLKITTAGKSTFKPVAVLKLFSKSQKFSKKRKDNHLANFIIKRVTSRCKYGNDLPPKFLINKFKKVTGSGLNIYFITEKEKRERAIDIAIAAGIEAMGDKNFRDELSHHVKPNITMSKIGMPAYGMEIPTPVSFLAPLLIRMFNMNKVQSAKDKKTFVETPLLLLIASMKNEPNDWVKVGLTYQEIALLLTANRFSSHPMAGPIQISRYRGEIKELFGAKDFPQFFFRVGKPLRDVKHSPRLPAEEVMISE